MTKTVNSTMKPSGCSLGSHLAPAVHKCDVSPSSHRPRPRSPLRHRPVVLGFAAEKVKERFRPTPTPNAHAQRPTVPFLLRLVFPRAALYECKAARGVLFSNCSTTRDSRPEDTKKYYFTVIDFRGATSHFAETMAGTLFSFPSRQLLTGRIGECILPIS
jgi:hypothetical protein